MSNVFLISPFGPDACTSRHAKVLAEARIVGNDPEPMMDDERRAMLIAEAGKTNSGQDKDFDPRELDMLKEYQAYYDSVARDLERFVTRNEIE